MEYIALVLALALGYVIGLLQNGINIHHKDLEYPEEYNESVGTKEYEQYYDEQQGINNF